jgi:ferredoxin-thioredoxin reductase catalytic subunit
MARHEERIGEKKNTCRILLGKPEEKRSLGKTKT